LHNYLSLGDKEYLAQTEEHKSVVKKPQQTTSMSTETQEIDNLPDNCGFEPSHSTGPINSRGGVDSETQATNPSTDLGQKPGPRIVRIEEVKRPSNKPFTKEVTTEAGMDTMLGGCKIGPKES
jgi:hypothetical protein